MAQLSISNYFNNKKRPSVDDVNNAKKVLILEDNASPVVSTFLDHQIDLQDVKNKIKCASVTPTTRKTATPRSRKLKPLPNQGNIRQFFSSNNEPRLLSPERNTAPSSSDLHAQNPGASPVKTCGCNTAATESSKPAEPTLEQIAQKLSRSSRLAEIKASLARFQQSELKLEVAKQKSHETKQALSLKNFKTLELEVNLSPQKVQSPEKQYLSPKKEPQGARKQLFGLSSPVKPVVASPAKPSLTLPFKYRYLAEIFRAIDTVCQIMHNRKETITFKKLKPAVESLLKRNLTEKHLSQIGHIYPDSFTFRRDKLKEFGARIETWELIIEPQLEKVGDHLTSEVLIERRRKLFKTLIEKVKDYHQEFLMTLDPPMEIERSKLTRWHPSFDIEKVPDIEIAELPSPPLEEKLTTGSEVLQKARELFNCNTRMERALERLQESSSQTAGVQEPSPQESVLKGIPKALLEKVRQKQAAKALEAMTRSVAKDEEVEMYLKLPEIARLTRNLFVSEKRSVLLRDLVIDRLSNSYNAFVSKNDFEVYLRTIAKEINGWLVFHEIRGEVFIKLAKNSDMSVVMSKLQKLAELKDS